MLVCLMNLVSQVALAVESQPLSISGRVVLVKLTTNQVLVAHKKPGALIETISVFNVDNKTQFKNINGTASLKINDPISVAYTESEAGNLAARVLEKREIPSKSASK